MSTFDYFNQLPQELQAVILAIDVTTLSYVKLLNKSLFYNIHIVREFYNQYGNLPIDNKEMRTYLIKTLPQ
jgi:hypothetical protein